MLQGIKKCRWIDSVHPWEGGREFVGSVDANRPGSSGHAVQLMSYVLPCASKTAHLCPRE